MRTTRFGGSCPRRASPVALVGCKALPHCWRRQWRGNASLLLRRHRRLVASIAQVWNGVLRSVAALAFLQAVLSRSHDIRGHGTYSRDWVTTCTNSIFTLIPQYIYGMHLAHQASPIEHLHSSIQTLILSSHIVSTLFIITYANPLYPPHYSPSQNILPTASGPHWQPFSHRNIL